MIIQSGNPVQWHKLLGTISLLGLCIFLGGCSDGKHGVSTHVSIFPADSFLLQWQ